MIIYRKILIHLSGNQVDTKSKFLFGQTLNKIEDYIEHVFSASKVKTYKVSPLVYSMATTYFDVGPSKIFFVSSNAWDISGAKHFGYKTIWVNRNKVTYDFLTDTPDYEIKTLNELNKIINADGT